jgi:phage FluMu gp28-like protein
VVEPVTFTGPIKERLAVETKRCFEERLLRVPESRSIRRAVQSVKRFVTATGNLRFDAARTEKGHADEFWALALAVSASSTKGYVAASEGGMVGDTIAGRVMELVF